MEQFVCSLCVVLEAAYKMKKKKDLTTGWLSEKKTQSIHLGSFVGKLPNKDG